MISIGFFMVFVADMNSRILAQDAPGREDRPVRCWKTSHPKDKTTISDRRSETKLCFQTDKQGQLLGHGRYILLISACPWGLKQPCEGWPIELEYKWNGKTLAMSTIKESEPNIITYCRQELAGLVPAKFVSCIMPGVEWVKVSDDVKQR